MRYRSRLLIALALVEAGHADGTTFISTQVLEEYFAAATGCAELLTENLQDGRRIDGLVIRNPFKRARQRL